MVIAPGELVAGQYRLIRLLGQGGSAMVWLAHDEKADVDMAIKLYGSVDDNGMEEFRKEFKLAYRLNHPNLLNVGHLDVCDNIPFLVMPFCEKGSVASKVGKFTEEEIWQFVENVSCGLAFLHSQHPPIVHQDIKPDNILMTNDGRFVITDFGISRSFQTRRSIYTRSVNSGTIAYMGPERFSENPMIVMASDIWSFGMTLYEVVTGDVLWEGNGGCAQLNGARLPYFSRQMSPELSLLIQSCLNPQTWNRPSAAQIHRYAETRDPSELPLAPHPAAPDEPSYVSNDTTTVRRTVDPSSAHSTSFLGLLTSYLKPLLSNRRYQLAAAILLAVIVVGFGIARLLGDARNDNMSTQPSIAATDTLTAADTLSATSATQVKTADNNSSTTPASTGKTQSKRQESTEKVIIYRTDPSARTTTGGSSSGSNTTSASKSAASGKSASSGTSSTAKTSSYSAAQDDADFRNCKTAADFSNYLSKYCPGGRHCDAARRALSSSNLGDVVNGGNDATQPSNQGNSTPQHNPERPATKVNKTDVHVNFGGADRQMPPRIGRRRR